MHPPPAAGPTDTGSTDTGSTGHDAPPAFGKDGAGPEKSGPEKSGSEHTSFESPGPAPSAADLAAAIGRLSRASVLVVGDAMLDRYIYGSVGRISPEAPVPVLSVQRELSLPGGAANVVRNLGALGVAVAFVSVVGDDQAGANLTGLIGGQPGVEPWLLVQGGRATTMKTRFVAQSRQVADHQSAHQQQGHQLLRADREDIRPIHPKLVDRMLRIAGDAMAATSVTVLSDYRKGVLGEDVPERLIAAARAAGRRVVADVHGPDHGRYAGADVVVIAARDLIDTHGLPVEGDAALTEIVSALRLRHGFGAVLAMRGEEGITLVDAAGAVHFPAEATEIFDIAGTNDTAAATLGAALATGVDLRLAARLANLAAGIVVGKIGTAVVCQDDLLATIGYPAGTALPRPDAGRPLEAEPAAD